MASSTIDPSGKRLEGHLKALLYPLMSCRTQSDDLTTCNSFVARALRLCYQISDFCIPAKNQNSEEEYLSANDIASRIATKWGFIGTAATQSSLRQAQAYANAGRAVIAARQDKPDGHVCLILPGEMMPSGEWGMDVPNSASFSKNSVAKCYIGDKLSYAFRPAMKATVLLYYK